MWTCVLVQIFDKSVNPPNLNNNPGRLGKGTVVLGVHWNVTLRLTSKASITKLVGKDEVNSSPVGQTDHKTVKWFPTSTVVLVLAVA